MASENFAEFFSLAVSKFLIDLAVNRLGWRVTHGPIYLYNRPDPHGSDEQYQMMHSVSVYERIPDFGERLDTPGSGLYTRTASQIINDGVEWIETMLETPDVREEVEGDLARVIEFANRDRPG